MSEMFSDEPAPDITKGKGGGSSRLLFDGLKPHELISYRDEIDRRLPPLTLGDIDLEEQMLLQFHSTRSLQSDVITEEGIPANQRAQVANAVAACLAKLTEMQERLYTSERLKMCEKVLIRCLAKLPDEVVEEFLALYKAELEKMSGKNR